MSTKSNSRFFSCVAVAAILGLGCGEEQTGAGAGGVGGYGGAGGFGGIGGTASIGGVGGEAGFAGIGGTGGEAGFSGIGGTGGEAGFSGVGGTGGQAGFSGVGGTGGFSGVGGEAGFSGIGGSGGAAGFSGIGGTGGMGGLGGAGGGIMRGDAPTEMSASNNGPYTVGMYKSGFDNPPGGFSAATIYHPTNADAPFAMVVICPGFLNSQPSIAAWGPFFASHGIVTMTMDTGTINDSVVMRADQLWEALTSLKGEHTRAGSPLNGKLDLMRAGLMGWSMGGGGTWINANTHPDLKTAVSLAGHISTAGGAPTVPMISVPAFLCAGQVDNPILGGGMSQPVYNVIPNATPKMLYEVAGGDHNVCNTPTSNGNITGRYILSWQKVYLEGDERYRQFLLQMPSGTSDFKTNVQ